MNNADPSGTYAGVLGGIFGGGFFDGGGLAAAGDAAAGAVADFVALPAVAFAAGAAVGTGACDLGDAWANHISGVGTLSMAAPAHPFPGVNPDAQAKHDPHDPGYIPGKTPLDVNDLPPGVSVEDALEEAWNNPVAGDLSGKGQIFGKVSFPVNSLGWEWLDLRFRPGKGDSNLHGWPHPGPPFP